MHGRERARRAIAALLASRAESDDELAGDAALRPTAPAAGVGAAASETALLAQPAATGDSEWGSSPSRTLVAIDRSGAVMSPLRRYVGRAAAYGALSILSTIGVCSLASGDPLVMALSLVGTAAWGHGILVTRWLEQASALTLRGELDRAEALLRRCLRPPWGSEGVRAHAHLRLSGIATRRGDHAQAVRESRHGQRRAAAGRPLPSGGNRRAADRRLPAGAALPDRAVRRPGRGPHAVPRCAAVGPHPGGAAHPAGGAAARPVLLGLLQARR
jgi:hypothetical protein